MRVLKQSTAVTLLIGPFLDDGDGKSAETGLTISQADVRLSKNGGDMAQKGDATSCTHDELGYYTCPLSTTDTGTLGILKVMVHESGALPVWHEYTVVPAAVYDSLVLGTDYLPVDVAEISSDSTAANNAEAFFDGTGYAGGTTKLQVNATLIEGSDATDQIRDAIVDDATRIDASALNTLSSHDPGATIGTADPGDAMTLTAAYDAAKTAAQAGDEMDLIDAPNVTAVTAIQSGLAATGEAATAVGTLNDLSAANVEDAVWDATLADHDDAGSTGLALAGAGGAGDPWGTALPGAYGDGTAGKILGTNLDAAISTRSTLTAQQVWEYGTRSLSTFGTLVADVATAVWGAVARTITGGTVTTNSDKTGYTLTGDYDAAKTAAAAGAKMDLVDAPNATAVTAIQNGLAATGEAATAVGTLNDFDPALDVVAHVTLVDTTTTNTDMRGTDGAELAGAAAAAVGGLNDFDPTSDTVDVGAVAGAAVTGVNDFKADVSGLALTGEAATAVGTLNDFDPAAETVDVGAVAGVAVTGVNDFKADVSGLALTGEAATAVGTLNDLSAAEVEDAVWDAATADHTAAGSMGVAVSGAGDPWSTALPGLYGAGTAGKLVGDNLDAKISTRSTLTAAQVWAAGTRTLTGFGTLVADVATAVWTAVARTITGGTVTTVSDKTGYALTAAYDAAQTAAQAAALATVAANVLRTLGLSQENQYIDSVTVDVSGRMTSARLRTYSVAGSVGTINDVLATYTITATYTGTEEAPTTYKVVRV
jgi:hypothetical protein